MNLVAEAIRDVSRRGDIVLDPFGRSGTMVLAAEKTGRRAQLFKLDRSYVVDAADPEMAVAEVMAVVRDRIPRAFGLDPVRDVQALCPMNRGGGGARSLNVEFQRVLNPPGDKAIQVENDYDREVYNGDLGLVACIDREAGKLVVSFDGREVVYGFGELDALVLAYATTVHKAQRSEYPAVVIPVMTQHYAMLARNLLYTGVTRGKRLVVLVDQRKAIAMAVRNGGQRRRWSKLGERMVAVRNVGIGEAVSPSPDYYPLAGHPRSRRED